MFVLGGRITVGFINLLKIGSLTVKVVDQRLSSIENPEGTKSSWAHL